VYGKHGTNPRPILYYPPILPPLHSPRMPPTIKRSTPSGTFRYNNRDGMNPADLLRFLEELEKVTEAVWVIGTQVISEREND
jgi:hypothetical protein